MRRWRGDLMRLSPLLQGGSHLMIINLILSLSHLPRIETSAAFSDNCSCLMLSSSCHARLTCFCALCTPESGQKFSSDQSSQATFTQHCQQKKETFFLCVFQSALWSHLAVLVAQTRLLVILVLFNKIKLKKKALLHTAPSLSQAWVDLRSANLRAL